MKLKSISAIKTKEEARQMAIEFWKSKKSMSYKECTHWHIYFEILGENFGLTQEFKENCII